MKISRAFRQVLCACVPLFFAIGCGGRVEETVVEGCGANPPSGDASSGDASSGNASNGNASNGDDPDPVAASIAASLDGLRWELPCTSPREPPGCNTLGDPVTQSTTLAGTSGAVYDVALRFRGVIEQRTYDGGQQNGYWYAGGDTPSRSDPFNIYSLAISSPPQSYYVNAGSSFINNVFGVDYTETVQVAAGATVTLTADSTEGTEIMNVDANGNPVVVAGIAPAPAAFNGQFLQVDVVSVKPHTA